MMTPRAVVIPFGVPTESKGLGLGLAALFQGFAMLGGQGVGLAQLVARPREDGSPSHDGTRSASPGPVEAFVPPEAWRDLARHGHGLPEVVLVITGAFEPPGSGHGTLQLLAFDASDGSTRGRTDVHLDAARAGETILAAFDEVWSKVGGELGHIREIGDLGWEALESVLRAERCVLHDPLRQGPHDSLAALLHLGRAVGDAPLSKFPAGRLATVALETATAANFDWKLTTAALRALSRASDDAPSQVDLVEAAAALHVKLGHGREAEATAKEGIERAPDRARLYATLSEARRGLGDLDGALGAVDEGLMRAVDDGLLATERGIVLAKRGDLSAAEAAWKRVLSKNAIHPSAFVHLAAVAAERKDGLLAQAMVDQALTAVQIAHPDVLRRAIHLAVATEEDGLPRAARVATLATSLVARVGGDAWGHLVLAQARARLGETKVALIGFARVSDLAPESALAAEAQRERLTCADPRASLEVEALLRAAETAAVEELDGIAVRGRRLAAQHGVWTAEFARGVAERRRSRWTAARSAFDDALKLAPGATPAHIELVDVCVALGAAGDALRHAERALVLEGRSPRALGCFAVALVAVDRIGDAAVAAQAALVGLPDDVRLQGIARGEAATPKRPSFWERLRPQRG